MCSRLDVCSQQQRLPGELTNLSCAANTVCAVCLEGGTLCRDADSDAFFFLSAAPLSCVPLGPKRSRHSADLCCCRPRGTSPANSQFHHGNGKNRSWVAFWQLEGDGESGNGL